MQNKILSVFMLLSLIFVLGCGGDELPDEELTVTGVVMNPDGGRVSSATIMIVDAGSNKQAAIGQTDSAGRFAIQISPGNYIAYARGEQTEGRITQKMEGMTAPFSITTDEVTPRMTLQLYNIVRIRTMCNLTEEEVNEHEDKKELIAFFSRQKFRELGIKEGQIVKVENLSTRRDIVVYAFKSDQILCEMSVPPVVVGKLTGPFGRQDEDESTVISVSIEVSIVAPELFR